MNKSNYILVLIMFVCFLQIAFVSDSFAESRYKTVEKGGTGGCPNCNGLAGELDNARKKLETADKRYAAETSELTRLKEQYKEKKILFDALDKVQTSSDHASEHKRELGSLSEAIARLESSIEFYRNTERMYLDTIAKALEGHLQDCEASCREKARKTASPQPVAHQCALCDKEAEEVGKALAEVSLIEDRVYELRAEEAAKNKDIKGKELPDRLVMEEKLDGLKLPGHLSSRLNALKLAKTSYMSTVTAYNIDSIDVLKRKIKELSSEQSAAENKAGALQKQLRKCEKKKECKDKSKPVAKPASGKDAISKPSAATIPKPSETKKDAPAKSTAAEQQKKSAPSTKRGGLVGGVDDVGDQIRGK